MNCNIYLNFSKASASVDWCWCGKAWVWAAQGLGVEFWFSSVIHEMDGSYQQENKEKQEFLELPRDGLIYWATCSCFQWGEGGGNRTSKKVTCSPVFLNKMFQMEIRLLCKVTLLTCFRLLKAPVFSKWISFVQMAHMIWETN